MITAESPGVARIDHPCGVKIWVHNQTEASFRANCCKKEPWTAEFINTLPEGVPFFDIGANVGSYSLIAAKLGHPVLAIEPSFSNYTALIRNAILNQLNERIIALPLAVGAATTLDWLHLQNLESGAASHHLGQPANGNRPVWFHRCAVLNVRLDQLVGAFGLPAPTHVKIDTDGNEKAVLEGFGELAAGVQAVMIETRDADEAALAEMLKGWGLEQRGRFAERDGKPLIGLSYGYWVRPS